MMKIHLSFNSWSNSAGFSQTCGVFNQRYGTVLTFSMLNQKHKIKYHSKTVATQPSDEKYKKEFPW